MTIPFEDMRYKNISLDELVTYAIYDLNINKIEATFENIVARCYKLFPKKFALIGYPNWPDSSRVNKSWLRCRTDFKYISGSVKKGFSLTSNGLDIVKSVQKRLKFKSNNLGKINKRIVEERSREEMFLNNLEKSDVYKNFSNNQANFNMTEFDLCDALVCTLESSFSIRRKNLNILKEYANRLSRKDILNFLNFCEKNYKNYIYGQIGNGDDNTYRGGMAKKKRKGK